MTQDSNPELSEFFLCVNHEVSTHSVVFYLLQVSFDIKAKESFVWLNLMALSGSVVIPPTMSQVVNP